MAGTYSQTFHEGKSSQYAYALVILSGGIALVVSQVVAPNGAPFIFALMAALFASVWPDRSLQWAVWLCLPIFLLIFIDLLMTGRIAVLLRNGILFVQVFPLACLGAFIGSRLSIVNRFSNMRVQRRRAARGDARKAHSSPVTNSMTVPLGNFKRGASRHGSNGHALALEKRPTPAPDLNGSLIKATQEGDAERISLLVAQGADVNAKSHDQWTPLMIAALGAETEVLNTLFGSGAVPESVNGKGCTALMIAAIEGQTEVVRALLEHGASVNAKNGAGWTALRFAVSMNETEILRALLDAGADVNLQDNEGRTALMQAACENLWESIKALLEAGADPHLRDNRGQTALMIARAHGQRESIRLLKEAEARSRALASTDILSGDFSYLYHLKEELEDGLNSHLQHPAQGATDETLARLLDTIQTVQEQIDAARLARALTPSEISHKLVLTLKEAATLSGLPRQHLLEAVEEGRLKAQLVKHCWRIKRADLDDYVRRLK